MVSFTLYSCAWVTDRGDAHPKLLGRGGGTLELNVRSDILIQRSLPHQIFANDHIAPATLLVELIWREELSRAWLLATD